MMKQTVTFFVETKDGVVTRISPSRIYQPATVNHEKRERQDKED